jgi:hypothetical protein
MASQQEFIDNAIARMNAYKAYVEMTSPTASAADLAHEGGEVIRDMMLWLAETEGATGIAEPFAEITVQCPPAEGPRD